MIISPIIVGLATVAFFLFYQVWKYLFLWQMGQPESGDTGGLFFPKALTHVFVGVYIQQVCLAALFFLGGVPIEGGFTVVLIIATVRVFLFFVKGEVWLTDLSTYRLGIIIFLSTRTEV